ITPEAGSGCGLTIEKVDKDTEEPLSGVSFTVVGPGGKEWLAGPTNENGEAVLEHLPAGAYTIKKEFNTPAGYEPLEEDITVQVPGTENGQTQNHGTVRVEYERKTG